MSLSIECQTPRGKIVTIPVKETGKTTVLFMKGVELHVDALDAEHRYMVSHHYDEFTADPNHESDKTTIMHEQTNLYSGRRTVIWDLHESVAIDMHCKVPSKKGMRRRFVSARVWETENALTSDPR